MHRSAWRLAWEAVEDLTHFDGRFWRTLRRLIVDPGRLTRDYIEGRRAGEVSPLRLFLITLLLVFFVGSATHGGQSAFSFAPSAPIQSVLSPGDKADLRDPRVRFGRSGSDLGAAWLQAHVDRAARNPERFRAALEQWAHQFAFVLLPVSALLLTCLFAFQRRFYVFDHLVFAMHSLSFQGMLLSTVWIAGLAPLQAGWLLLASPVHLFLHLRGTYATGVVWTLVRMLLLFVGTCVTSALLMVGLVLVGLSALPE